MANTITVSQYLSTIETLKCIPSLPSGELDTSTLIHTGPALVTGVKIRTNGTNDVTVELHNTVDGSGDPVDTWKVTGSENYGGTQYGFAPVYMDTALYISVSGTGGLFYVFYAPSPPKLVMFNE